MNTLILIADKYRKSASAELHREFIDNVIVLGGIEVEDENTEHACAILANHGIVHAIQEFEL